MESYIKDNKLDKSNILSTVSLGAYKIDGKNDVYPLQLIRTPIVAASLILKPAILAPIEAPKNFPTQAVKIIPIVNAHTRPVSIKPRSVERPDIVKY